VTSDSEQIRALNESRNVALIRRFVDAFNRMDFDSVRSDAHPDVELHEWPQAPGARTYHGWDAVRQGIDGWFEAWECDGKLIRMELFIEREPALEAAGLPPEHQEEMR